MQRIEYCPTCGQRVSSEGAAYCDKCGSPLGGDTNTRGSQRQETWMGRRRRPRDRYDPVWGIVSFIGFLVILGLTFLAFPNLISRIASYFEELARLGRPVLPSYNLGEPLIYFLNISGIWGIIFGALGMGFGRGLRRSVDSIISGAYSLYLAQLFSQFYSRAIAGETLVLDAIVGLGLVIIAQIAIWAAFRFRQY